jgi:hypothetical protein
VEEVVVVAKGPDSPLVAEAVMENHPVEEREGNGLGAVAEESEEDGSVYLEHLCCGISEVSGTVICCMIASSIDRADFHGFGFDFDFDFDFGCS